jgi:hypothetical protein
MKKVIAMLSAFLFSFGVANAGELSITGSAKASYAIASSDNASSPLHRDKALGISNEFTLGASGELDNGYTWSYAIDIDAVESGATNDDAKLSLTTPQGTIGIFLGEGALGVDNAGSQSVIARPSDTSYAELMTDTFDIDGFDNIQYHTPADLLPFGITAKIGYAPGAEANVKDFKATGTDHTPSSNRFATVDQASAGGITLAGGGDAVTHYQVKAAPIDGLSVGFDYLEFSGVIGSSEQAPESGAYFATYTFGPATIGYSKSFAALPMNDITTEVVEQVENTKMSIGINVNDNLSVSYEQEESTPTLSKASAAYELESTGIQAAYTMGGMTLGIAMNDHKNTEYTQNKDIKDTVFTVQMAF